MNKPRLGHRSEIIKQRLALSSEEIASKSQIACSHIINSAFWQSSRHIAFYIAQTGETDPQTLLNLAASQGKTCYLPALANSTQNQLVMVRYQTGDPLPANRFRIPEPVQTPNAIIAPEQLDLVIVPLVAYDSYGSRLGMGLGYYDRTFAFLKQKDRPTRPLLVGLAYSFQQIEMIKREEWDVPLDCIANELTLLKI